MLMSTLMNQDFAKGKENLHHLIPCSVMIGPGFSLLPRGVLGVFYALVLAYIFLGVAIVSDIFMEAIEEITS